MYELFSKSGDVKRIVIGLDKVKKTACGFCFVEYPFCEILSVMCCFTLVFILLFNISAYIIQARASERGRVLIHYN